MYNLSLSQGKTGCGAEVFQPRLKLNRVQSTSVGILYKCNTRYMPCSIYTIDAEICKQIRKAESAL